MDRLSEKLGNLIISAGEQFLVASVQAFHAIVFALLTIPESISSATSLGELAWDQLSSPGPHAPAGDLTFRLIKIWTNHVVDVELPRFRKLAAGIVSCCCPKNLTRVEFYQVGFNSKCAVRGLRLDYSELIENRMRVKLSDRDVVVVEERPESAHDGRLEGNAEVGLHYLLETGLGAVSGIHELLQENLGRSTLVRPLNEQFEKVGAQVCRRPTFGEQIGLHPLDRNDVARCHE